MSFFHNKDVTFTILSLKRNSVLYSEIFCSIQPKYDPGWPARSRETQTLIDLSRVSTVRACQIEPLNRRQQVFRPLSGRHPADRLSCSSRLSDTWQAFRLSDTFLSSSCQNMNPDELGLSRHETNREECKARLDSGMLFIDPKNTANQLICWDIFRQNFRHPV